MNIRLDSYQSIVHVGWVGMVGSTSGYDHLLWLLLEVRVHDWGLLLWRSVVGVLRNFRHGVHLPVVKRLKVTACGPRHPSRQGVMWLLLLHVLPSRCGSLPRSCHGFLVVVTVVDWQCIKVVLLLLLLLAWLLVMAIVQVYDAGVSPGTLSERGHVLQVHAPAVGVLIVLDSHGCGSTGGDNSHPWRCPVPYCHRVVCWLRLRQLGSSLGIEGRGLWQWHLLPHRYRLTVASLQGRVIPALLVVDVVGHLVHRVGLAMLVFICRVVLVVHRGQGHRVVRLVRRAGSR